MTWNMWLGCRKQGMHTKFWQKNLFKNICLEDQGNETIMMDLKEIHCKDHRWMKLGHNLVQWFWYQQC
jgi:hypothetical protein